MSVYCFRHTVDVLNIFLNSILVIKISTPNIHFEFLGKFSLVRALGKGPFDDNSQIICEKIHV